MPSLGSSDGTDWVSALTDAQGSVLRHIDDTGTMTALTRYDPYGGARPSTSLPDGFGYTGEWADATGLVNLRARAYDPSLGAFLSRDAFGGLSTMPLTGNRHAYASGNPLRFTDPSGRFIKALMGMLAPQAELAMYACITGSDVPICPMPGPEKCYPQHACPWWTLPTPGGGQGDFTFQDLRDIVLACSFAPGAGTPCDIADAILSLIEGDAVGGIVSLAGVIPVADLLKLPRAALRGADIVNATKAIARRTSWHDSTKLAEHAADHAAEFGYKSVDEYAKGASDFLRTWTSRQVRVKVDDRGIVRVWEPSTNTFGVYTEAGETITYFKLDPAKHPHATNEDYWDAVQGDEWIPPT